MGSVPGPHALLTLQAGGSPLGAQKTEPGRALLTPRARLLGRHRRRGRGKAGKEVACLAGAGYLLNKTGEEEEEPSQEPGGLWSGGSYFASLGAQTEGGPGGWRGGAGGASTPLRC